MMFGGAKPVPVNYLRLRQPARDMMFVALAGPISNLLLAIVFVLILKLLTYGGGMGEQTIAVQVMVASARWNILLAAFNMLPIPPLDGSRVVSYLLPASLRQGYATLERFGMLIVFGLLFTGVLWSLIGPMMVTVTRAIDFLTGGNWS